MAKLRLMVLSLERKRWHFTASPHKPSLRKWGYGFTQLSLQKPMLAVTQHCASSTAVFTKPRAGCSLMLSTLLSLLLLQGNQHSDFLKSVPVSFPKNWRRLPCDVKAKPLKCQEGQEVPVAPTQPCTKSPARAKQKLFALFWRNITVLLVVTPWASSLWRLRRALQSGTAGTRGLQGWREGADEEVVCRQWPLTASWLWVRAAREGDGVWIAPDRTSSPPLFSIYNKLFSIFLVICKHTCLQPFLTG